MLKAPVLAFFSAVVWIMTIGLAHAANSVIVGVNVEDFGHMNDQQQDALLAELKKAGVSTIRTGILHQGLMEPKTAHFIFGAYKLGIKTVLIIYPKMGASDQHTAPANPKMGRPWPVPALSDVNPDGFKSWMTPQLAALESASVELAAFELGNEFNTPGFNGDFEVPGSGRILSINDLNNASDSEATQVAAGYKAYLRVLAVLKQMRDQSKVNGDTPIILGGLANVDLPTAHSYNSRAAVAIPDSIAYLRQNGLDRLVDGYGVHFYPSGDPHQRLSERIAKLASNAFAECSKSTKPCWLTEWNINNPTKTCPIDDSTREDTVTVEREAIKSFVQQGRVAAVLWYTWSGDYFGEKENQGAIFRCGAETIAGQAALRPF